MVEEEEELVNNPVVGLCLLRSKFTVTHFLFEHVTHTHTHDSARPDQQGAAGLPLGPQFEVDVA